MLPCYAEQLSSRLFAPSRCPKVAKGVGIRESVVDTLKGNPSPSGLAIAHEPKPSCQAHDFDAVTGPGGSDWRYGTDSVGCKAKYVFEASSRPMRLLISQPDQTKSLCYLHMCEKFHCVATYLACLWSSEMRFGRSPSSKLASLQSLHNRAQPSTMTLTVAQIQKCLDSHKPRTSFAQSRYPYF